MINIEEIKTLIVERLKPLNLDKIILFGSYAYGIPNKDSDIDLYVVTKDDFMPKSFKEKSVVYSQIASKMKDIVQIYPTDLIVHTKKMHEKFIEMDSMFSRKILQEGISLI